jgi:hypothetical protein
MLIQKKQTEPFSHVIKAQMIKETTLQNKKNTL